MKFKLRISRLLIPCLLIGMMVFMPSGLLNAPSLGYGEYDQFSVLDSQAGNRTGISHRYNNGALDLQMDNFSIRILNETYPHFMFWNAMNQTGDQYHIRMMELVEFNDTNGDGIPQLSEEKSKRSQKNSNSSYFFPLKMVSCKLVKKPSCSSCPSW